MPPADGLRLIVNTGLIAVKLARTVLLDVILNEQLLLVPEQDPLELPFQLLKVYPDAGLAVSVTWELYVLVPARVPETVPPLEGSTLIARVGVIALKLTFTVLFWSITMMQVLPFGLVQPLVQPLNSCPVAGLAVKVTTSR